MFTVEKHTARMTGAAWFIVTTDNNGIKVEGTDYYGDHEDAMLEAERRNRNFMDIMPHPNIMGESLYRALYEELGDWFTSMPEDNQGEVAASFANDLRETAKLIDEKVKEFEKANLTPTNPLDPAPEGWDGTQPLT